MNILFVNPSRVNCGIHQFGLRVYGALMQHLSEYGDFRLSYYQTYNSYDLLRTRIAVVQPDIILWSFNATALPVVTDGMSIIATRAWPNIRHIGICHEQEQIMVDRPDLRDWHWFGAPGFNAWVGHDPTLVIDEDKQPNLFRAARPVLRSEWRTTPGSAVAPYKFGNSTFGFPNKGHTRICRAIQSEFSEAVIRFNMPPSEYGDPHLEQARAVETRCREILANTPGIKLEVTHDMLKTEQEVATFLYGNDVNIFDYDQGRVPEDMRGVASSPDTALSTRRPLIVTGSTMFRHLHPLFRRYPEDGSLRDLISRQLSCNVPDFVYNEWTPARMTADYVRVIYKVLR